MEEYNHVKITSPYSFPQRWLKGNLHTHTTRSDGTSPPEQVIAMYRDDNYDFLALTDHGRLSVGDEGSSGEMLLLAGQECHIPSGSDGFPFHIVGIGLEREVPPVEGGQAIIDAVNAAGGLAVVCHPRWSFMPYEVFDALEGYAAFEVYNGVCEKEVGRGFSNDYWDAYMTKYSRPVNAFAVDDLHLDSREFATGWTFVNAPKTHEGIYDALRRGDAYSSNGPRIETIKVSGEAITIHTSSAKAVKFVSRDGETAAKVEGEHVKVATYAPKGDEVYIRAEVHAHDGRIAWTNPFFIEA